MAKGKMGGATMGSAGGGAVMNLSAGKGGMGKPAMADIKAQKTPAATSTKKLISSKPGDWNGSLPKGNGMASFTGSKPLMPK